MFGVRRRASEPERERLERLYVNYRKLMKAIAWEILGDEATAEDAVQDAFERILPHVNRLSDLDSPETRAYVVVVVKGVAIDLYRRRKRGSAARRSTGGAADRRSEPEQALIDGLAAQIANLPEKYRAPLVYRYLYGYSGEEIARALEIRPNTVYKRIERAKRMLFELLQEEV